MGYELFSEHDICELTIQHAPEVLRLNNAHEEETSRLDENGLQALLGQAFYARGLGLGATAFLIALDQHAKYESPNFLWFKDRYHSFVYIDRVIVSAAHRGRGIAKRLYVDLFSVAKQLGHTRVVCEVNLAPPNPASAAFHRSLDFRETGRAEIHKGLKTVCYLKKDLD